MESTEDTVLTTNLDGVLDGLPPLISVSLAAEILGLKRATAYRYAKVGGLPVRHFPGRRVYVVTAQLRKLIEEGEEAA
jgi:predicted site-specific integrase-resolvase